MVRKAVGPLVKGRVGERLALEHERDPLWEPGRLPFEPLVHTRDREVGRGFGLRRLCARRKLADGAV